MLDLSFTNDPQWQAERERLWQGIEKDLKANFRRKELNVIKHYFFSGELLEGYTISDGARFSYFPLQTNDAWDYILEEKLRSSASFEQILFDNFRDYSMEPHKAPYELMRWDYFLTETFEPEVKSRVPVGREKEIVSITLDPLRVFSMIQASISKFLNSGACGNWPKWIDRPKFYWGLWNYITDDCFERNDADENDSGATSVYFVENFLASTVEYKPRKDFPDPNQTRPKFLALLAEKMDEMYDDLCPRLQQLWDETKAKKAAKETGQ